MLVFSPAGVELFVMYLVAGSVAMLVFGFFNRGWLQFVTAFIVFVVMTIVWGAFRLTDGISGLTDYHTVLDTHSSPAPGTTDATAWITPS